MMLTMAQMPQYSEYAIQFQTPATVNAVAYIILNHEAGERKAHIRKR